MAKDYNCNCNKEALFSWSFTTLSLELLTFKVLHTSKEWTCTRSAAILIFVNFWPQKRYSNKLPTQRMLWVYWSLYNWTSLKTTQQSVVTWWDSHQKETLQEHPVHLYLVARGWSHSDAHYVTFFMKQLQVRALEIQLNPIGLQLNILHRKRVEIHTWM